MRELQAGLWHWQAPHPQWTPRQRWPQEVSSYAIDNGSRLLLFDPLAVPVGLYLIVWIESVRAVVAGDSLADFGTGLALNEWLRGRVTREGVVNRLRPLLELPVEFVLPAHGAPTDRAALKRALS